MLLTERDYGRLDYSIQKNKKELLNTEKKALH